MGRAGLGLAVMVALSAGCASAPAPPGRIEVPQGWPVDRAAASVSSPFGVRRSHGLHRGLDLAAAEGTSVRATAGGVVVFAGRSGDYGRLVELDHGGGWRTRYAHLSRIAVKRGRSVARGEVVGEVGHSGNASGDHLHYEVLHRGEALDPGPTIRR